MATTTVSTETARVVAHAYGNYRCDLGVLDFEKPHSVKQFIASAENLKEIQNKSLFWIIDDIEIEYLVKWAKRSPEAEI